MITQPSQPSHSFSNKRITDGNLQKFGPPGC